MNTSEHAFSVVKTVSTEGIRFKVGASICFHMPASEEMLFGK